VDEVDVVDVVDEVDKERSTDQLIIGRFRGKIALRIKEARLLPWAGLLTTMGSFIRHFPDDLILEITSFRA